MKAKASVTAQKLLNLYRQAHVIQGGWPVLNRVFIDEVTDEILAELQNLPTGKFLVAHIKNLRSGETPMDSIARELLPYGGMMVETEASANLSPEDLKSLIHAIDVFTPDSDGLNAFMNNPVVQRFGEDWIALTQNALVDNPNTLEKFDDVVRIYTAYKLWDSANNILSQPVNDRTRAELQVDMPEYETYLPMFGDQGQDLLHRLRALTSSLPSTDSDN